MNLFWNGLGMAFCALAAVLVLRETRKEWTPYILLTLCLLLFFTVLPFWQEMNIWLSALPGDGTYTAVLLKALGITLLTEAGSEICKSVGETAIAGYTAMIGKAELLWISLPMLQELITLAVDFLD